MTEASRDLAWHTLLSHRRQPQPGPACSNRSDQLSIFSVQSQASSLPSLTLEIEFNFEGYRKKEGGGGGEGERKEEGKKRRTGRRVW